METGSMDGWHHSQAHGSSASNTTVTHHHPNKDLLFPLCDRCATDRHACLPPKPRLGRKGFRFRFMVRLTRASQVTRHLPRPPPPSSSTPRPCPSSGLVLPLPGPFLIFCLFILIFILLYWRIAREIGQKTA
jgi:hypothetical protein